MKSTASFSLKLFNKFTFISPYLRCPHTFLPSIPCSLFSQFDLRHVRSSSRISLLSSVLEDDDGPPQPTPRKHFSETEAIVNRGLGENDDFAQNYAGLDVAGGVNVRGRRECRICKLGEDDSQALGALIEPCGCSGSMRFLHTRCLQRWLELKRNSTGTFDCCVLLLYFFVTIPLRTDVRGVRLQLQNHDEPSLPFTAQSSM